jgi:hypothetical protein
MERRAGGDTGRARPTERSIERPVRVRSGGVDESAPAAARARCVSRILSAPLLPCSGNAATGQQRIGRFDQILGKFIALDFFDRLVDESGVVVLGVGIFARGIDIDAFDDIDANILQSSCKAARPTEQID